MEEIIAWVKLQLETNEVFAGFIGGSLIVSLGYTLRSLPQKIWKAMSWLFLRYFTVKITITNADLGPYLLVAGWLNRVVGDKWNCVQMDFGVMPHYDTPPESTSADKCLEDVEHMERALTLGYGKFGFWYKRMYVRVSRTREKAENGGGDRRKPETLTLRFFTRNRDVVHDVFKAAHEDTKPTIYNADSYGNWNSSNTLAPREMSSIILPEEQKMRIMDDLDWFYNNTRIFKEAGIPCTRGFMFHGPPGTGKTSLARGLATHYQKNLYIVPLGELARDSTLLMLLDTIDPGSFVVFEDIDVVHAEVEQRENMEAPDGGDVEFENIQIRRGKPIRAGRSGSRSPGVTLGGLLQGLDGVNAMANYVVIMTSNQSPDVLDSALTRPGRLDLLEHIDVLGYEDAKKMAISLFDSSYLPVLDTIVFPMSGAEIQHRLLEENKRRYKLDKHENPGGIKGDTSEELDISGDSKSLHDIGVPSSTSGVSSS